MKKPNITPTLYHGTAHRCIGDAIIPNFVDTGAAWQFMPNAYNEPDDQADTFDDHRGSFVCATDNLQHAYIYAFKQCDDPRLHPDDRIKHIIGVGKITGADGVPINLALVEHKEEFLRNVALADPVIYRLPRVNTFRQVKTIDGKDTSEWVSRQTVALDRCREMPVPSIDDAMKKGLQFFFIDERLTADRVQRAILGRMQEIMPPRDQFSSDQEHEAATNQVYMSVLKEAVDDELIHHYNAEKDICPVDLETGLLRTKPDLSFVDDLEKLKPARER